MKIVKLSKCLICKKLIEKPEYQELGLIECFRLHKQIKLLTENKSTLSSNITKALKF